VLPQWIASRYARGPTRRESARLGEEPAYPTVMANVLDYVELAVDDLAQATAFYAKALGWTFNDYGGEYAGIQYPRNPGQEVGGLNPRPVSSRGEGVLALVRTADAEAALASVQSAGGRVTTELHDYPGGRRFMFADPWGNILGVYEPSE
jgi:predicted enzyme related to lactoylglutathione lyase